MVGSDYVAYGGVGADQLRKQPSCFPYMNFNQPTQPGISRFGWRVCEVLVRAQG